MVGKRITESFSVEGQISLDQVSEIAAAGFKSLMCNRPDAEEPGQIPVGDIQAAAEAAGMTFYHVPVISGQVTQQNVDDFKSVLETAAAPMFAYCRSGTRCTVLWSLAEKESRPTSEILSLTAEAGYDMSGVMAQFA